jgi:branched-chain amino acid transport system ATP-binding protein
MTEPLLAVKRLSAGYGPIRALTEVDLSVPQRGAVALLGPNGAGKTTLVRVLTGLLRPTGGAVEIAGVGIAGRPPERIAGMGVAVVPEGRRLFPGMSVLDNLLTGAYRRRRDKAGVREQLTRMYELFPRLRDRAGQPAGSLSGGEQQMVAVARALMSRPKILVLDEPSLGLAPLTVQAMYESLAAVRDTGTAMLLIEQNVHMATSLCGRGYLLMNGRIHAEAEAADLRAIAARSYLDAG